VTRLEPFRDGVWLKREDEHELGAFKWRGAVAVLEARRPDVVVTARSGRVHTWSQEERAPVF